MLWLAVVLCSIWLYCNLFSSMQFFLIILLSKLVCWLICTIGPFLLLSLIVSVFCSFSKSEMLWWWSFLISVHKLLNDFIVCLFAWLQRPLSFSHCYYCLKIVTNVNRQRSECEWVWPNIHKNSVRTKQKTTTHQQTNLLYW